MTQKTAPQTIPSLSTLYLPSSSLLEACSHEAWRLSDAAFQGRHALSKHKLHTRKHIMVVRVTQIHISGYTLSYACRHVSVIKIASCPALFLPRATNRYLETTSTIAWKSHQPMMRHAFWYHIIFSNLDAETTECRETISQLEVLTPSSEKCSRHRWSRISTKQARTDFEGLYFHLTCYAEMNLWSNSSGTDEARPSIAEHLPD